MENKEKVFIAWLTKILNVTKPEQLDIELQKLNKDDLNLLAQKFETEVWSKMETTQYAKLGAKINYIAQLNGKCPEGYEVEKFLIGGKVCTKCKKKVETPVTKKKSVIDSIKEEIDSKKCGGKAKVKSKKKMQDGGKPYDEHEHATKIEEYQKGKIKYPSKEHDRLAELNRKAPNQDPAWNPKKKSSEDSNKIKPKQIRKNAKGGVNFVEQYVPEYSPGITSANAMWKQVTPKPRGFLPGELRQISVPKEVAEAYIYSNDGRADDDRYYLRDIMSEMENSLTASRKAASESSEAALSTAREIAKKPAKTKLDKQTLAALNTVLQLTKAEAEAEATVPATATPLVNPNPNKLPVNVAEKPLSINAVNTGTNPDISVYDWMLANGYSNQDASYRGRKALWQKIFGDTPYSGTSDQNIKLKQVLEKGQNLGANTDKMATMQNLTLLKPASAPSLMVKKPTV